MKLGLVTFPNGAHFAAWRDPRVPADAHVQLAQFAAAAQLAERGLLDFLFLADSAGLPGSTDLRAARWQPHHCGLEPVTLLAALAAVTRHIGLVATSSTSFYPPYQVARQFASLDHLSGGRAGVNLVTSRQDVEARNFGLAQHYEHADRYLRAEEFAEVVTGLWDSWDAGAFIRDKAAGVFFDPAQGHVLDHAGAHFSVRGPLNIPRTPQGRPILVQAGSSGPGKGFAARIADIVFTAQTALPAAQAFYAEVKALAAEHGRKPGDVIVMPGLSPIIGATKEEAQRKAAAVDDLIHIDMAVAQLSGIMGDIDLSAYPLDGPLPYDDIPETNGPKSRQQLLIDRARSEDLTIRQLAKSVVQSYGHGTVIGTVAEVADVMEEWVSGGAADGFNLTPTIMPFSLEDIVRALVPELQRRGLFRRAYEGTTLRENLGLAMPRSRYARDAAEG